MIGRIDHVMMWGKDLNHIARWYKDKLGFEIAYHAPGEFLSLIHKEMGRIDFHACGDDPSGIGRGPLPYHNVADIEKVRNYLVGQGVKVKEIQQVSDSPKHTWFWDCEGNIIGLEESN